jgi:hypothetical protein
MVGGDCPLAGRYLVLPGRTLAGGYLLAGH